MRKKRRIIKSGFEDRAKKAFADKGITAGYEKDVLDYTIPCTYRPDFTCTVDGSTIFVETKGYFDVESRRKMKYVKECNPTLDIRIWFQKDGYLTKAKKKKYSDWAKQHGYPYHIGESFPDHWFNIKEKK